MNKPRENRRQNRNLVNIRNYFKQYCASTSIHGFQYFGEDRSLFERVWWVFVFVVILSGCSFMIYKIYEKYDSSPVIVSFATKETPIYKIPFPAVTICPETKSQKDKFNYTEALEKNFEDLSEDEQRYLKAMSMVCDNHELYEELNFTLTDDFFNVLDELKPNVLGNIMECKFMGIERNCSELFTPIMTDEGVCYSFNILDRLHIFNDLVAHYKNYHHVEEDDTLDWNMERGYSDKAGIFAYPKRALISGAPNGLSLQILTWEEDLDYKCNGIQGYKVVLHAPIRIPKLKAEYFRLPLDQVVIAAVHPSMITTSEAVKSFDSSKRDCYFPSEKKLKYFKSYSQQNCQLECLTNYTFGGCGCVESFMPRENSTPICGGSNYECVKMWRNVYNFGELLLKFSEFSEVLAEELSNEELEEAKCDCLPLCTDLSYNVDTSQVDWKWEQTYDFPPNLAHLSSLTVYFKVNHFITSERQELYGPFDFVANFGGLLGLFTGFSMLSLMEIIYFLTVRICCNIRLYGRWPGTVDQ